MPINKVNGELLTWFEYAYNDHYLATNNFGSFPTGYVKAK